MKIVFIVSAYKLPEQLARLVKRLAVRGHTVLIHIDKRAKQSDFANMLCGSALTPKTHFMSSRHTCYWGGFGLVRAGISGLRMAVQVDTDFDFAVFLTGQCYPLISIAAIEAHLLEIGERSIISCCPMPVTCWPNGGMDYLQNRHFRIGSRLVVAPAPGSSWKRKLLNRIFKRRPYPSGLQPFYGGGYWVLHRRAVDFVLNFLRSRRDVVNYYKYSYIPDEMFFNTILGNSGLPIMNDLPYYVRFGPDNIGNPDVLTAADYPTLMQSNKMFARKFDRTIDESILTLLDTHADEQ